MTAARERVRVLYVMGHGWSGSTLLGNVLGQLDGVVHVGELRTLWGEALPAGALCGCGAPILECPLWSSVLERAFGRPFTSGVDPNEVAAAHRRAVRVRNTVRLLRLGPAEARAWADLRTYTDVLGRLYRSIADVTGARVVVDTSKRAGDASILRLVDGVDPSFLHLVRDPRAVAYSWRRRGGRGPAATARDWVVYNLADELIRRTSPGRPLRVRYEDFARAPGATLRRVAATLDGAKDLPFLQGTTVTLDAVHTILGNPARFRTGPVEIREDDEWRTRLPPRDRSIVTALTLPLLLRYGYPVLA